ncbi:MAG: hypothetical protein ACREIQ_03955, partial [Nitrospiria bacterium]
PRILSHRANFPSLVSAMKRLGVDMKEVSRSYVGARAEWLGTDFKSVPSWSSDLPALPDRQAGGQMPGHCYFYSKRFRIRGQALTPPIPLMAKRPGYDVCQHVMANFFP